MPKELKEFFVDSDPEDLDDETKEEFNLIFNKISTIYPFYKEVKEEIKEYINEKKDEKFTFIHIRTDKIIRFTDFDGKEHELIQTISNDNYPYYIVYLVFLYNFLQVFPFHPHLDIPISILIQIVLFFFPLLIHRFLSNNNEFEIDNSNIMDL